MITTPRGLPIPLPLDNSFCVMSRLYPTVKPYTILETTAGFYKMPGLVGFIAGITCFLLQLPAWQIAAITFAATVVGYVMSLLAIYPPGLLRLARIYSLVTGCGLVLVGLSVLGVCTVGMLGTGMFWAARVLAEEVTIVHANYMGRKFLRVVDPEMCASVDAAAKCFRTPRASCDGFAMRCWGNAYATYASKYGAPIEAVASEEELESGKWRAVLKEFVGEWPEVARRFQVTNDEWEDVLGNSGHKTNLMC
jgi:hypothetical protein